MAAMKRTIPDEKVLEKNNERKIIPAGYEPTDEDYEEMERMLWGEKYDNRFSKEAK